MLVGKFYSPCIDSFADLLTDLMRVPPSNPIMLEDESRYSVFFPEFYAHIHMRPSVFDFRAYRSTHEEVKLALRSRVGLKVILLGVICDGRRYAFWVAHSGEARPSNLRKSIMLVSELSEHHRERITYVVVVLDITVAISHNDYFSIRPNAHTP